MSIKFKNHFDNYQYVYLGVLITSIIILITFSLSGFYPLGENSILKVDLYHQYAPFHQELRKKLLTGDSLFYSWEGGLGKEFLSQIAYYTASPISILILFFPSRFISEAILLFVFLKIVLCSASFGYYLKKSFNRNYIAISIFSIMYAFMSYITSFYWNIMWLDSIYLFPIVALGIDKLIKDGTYKTYLISIFLSILVNFYIAFLVCIFATLYFICKLFSKYSVKKDFKIIYSRILRFIILSLLAGGLTMFLAIPTIIALGRTQTSDASFPDFKIYENIYQIINNHFSGAKPVVLARNEDLPNIYSGVITMVLLPTYFFNKKIVLKERILFFILIIFMIMCSIFKQLDFIIHGAHFPANLPHRYTFIYSFIILSLSYKSLIYRKGINLKVLYSFFAIYIFIITFTEYYIVKTLDLSRCLSDLDILANIILMSIYIILLILYKRSFLPCNKDNIILKNKKFSILFSTIFFLVVFIPFISGLIFQIINKIDVTYSFKFIVCIYIILIVFTSALFEFLYLNPRQNFNANAVLMLILIIISCESLFNSAVGFLHSGSTSREEYIKYIRNTDEALKYISENNIDENKFFRQEFARFTAINESTMYHYNGFSQFSSLAYGNTSKLIEKLGIAATSNSYRYYDPTPLLDSMFNIKYIMSKDKPLDNKNYNLVREFDYVYLYKNKTPLSLGFMVDNNIRNWETTKETPFEVQNDFVYKATNIKNEILTPIHVMNFKSENVDIVPKQGKLSEFTYKLHDEKNLNLIPNVSSSVYNPKTQRLFIYVESTNSKRFKYTINNHTNDREISTGRSLIDCGIVEAGEIININFSLDRKGSYDRTYSKKGSFRVYAAGFDNDVFEKIYKELEDEMLIVDNYNSTNVSGKINVREDGVMFTSIPYDKGFSVFVDGEKSEIIPIGNDGLIGVPLNKGEHNIEFKYNVQGFYFGLLLSLTSLFGIILYSIIDKKNNNNKILYNRTKQIFKKMSK